MNRECLISIIVPIYNAEKYLESCLNSIFKQTYKDFEVLLVDDGSQDASKEICMEFVKKDKRFKYYFKNNGGLSSARNFGIKNANGSILTFIDSDDWIDENYIETLVMPFLTNDNLDISISPYIEEYKSFSIKKGLYSSSSCDISRIQALEFSLIPETQIINCANAWCKAFKSFLFEKDIFKLNQLYEDYELLPKIFSHAREIKFCSEAFYHYRIRKGSIMRTLSNDSIYEAIKLDEMVFLKYGNYLTFRNAVPYFKHRFQSIIRMLEYVSDKTFIKKHMEIFTKDLSKYKISIKQLGISYFLIYYSYKIFGEIVGKLIKNMKRFRKASNTKNFFD